MSQKKTQQWLQIDGVDCQEIQSDLSQRVASLVSHGSMPANEESRVVELSTAIAKGSFVVSPQRLELLRGLCHLYSAGIRSEKITSHRRFLGPPIVFVKRAFFRVLSALLGPSFQFQRDFNAGVIRLLGDLCNEERSAKR